VYQRGSLLDGLAMYLSCDTKKFHDNESTHILHNFWTSTHRGEAFPLTPLAAPLDCDNTRITAFIAIQKRNRVTSKSPSVHIEHCNTLKVNYSRQYDFTIRQRCT